MTSTPEITALVERGVNEVIERRSLEAKLKRGKPLRVKFGIDPTGFQVHIGHVVPLRKLRAFQSAGHQAVIIIGDYTAQIGDPSGRQSTRTALSAEQTKKFAATYIDQISHILDIRRTEVRYNSEWFTRFTAADFLRLAMSVNANQLLTHETFRQRLDQGQPLGTHELLYPLFQGYDSVAVQADVELGGLDQKFSLLTGRDVQAAYGQEKQDIMLFDYLIGPDGREKMSKSVGNIIAIEDQPNDMYGKVMSIPDKLMLSYFTLATDADETVLREVATAIKKKTTNPRELKAKLAETIVALYHGEKAASAAAFEFTHIFRKKGAPSAIDVIEVGPGTHDILNLLVSHHLAASRSEARRLVEQGGVRIDQRPITDWEKPITAVNGAILQIGKRKFVKLSVRS